jgi:exopolyphosphatase/guanosine-5'-triphosphate,3'-diphosphate pyrophosphatase
VVSLSERYGGVDVSSDVFEAMVAEVARMLDLFPEASALDAAIASGTMHMLGTSGTVTTLAGVHLGLPRYDRRRVDGLWMTGDEIAASVSRLVATDYAGRVAHPCIGRERADLVLAGCAILEAISRRWGTRRLRVADRGLREGMLVELMAADGVWRRRERA